VASAGRGHASSSIHAFDLLGGTLEGFNSAGLVVAILANNDATAELGPKLDPHLGAMQVVGLHELAAMRLLLDTCATVAEAKESLLTMKQYYRFIPLHYLIADRTGRSFIYESSTGRNVQHIIDGDGRPQVLTNFQLHKHLTPKALASAHVAMENEASWRYNKLMERIGSGLGRFTPADMKQAIACVNVVNMIDTLPEDSPLRAVTTRTIWESLHDQQAATLECSFYLGEDVQPDGKRRERRSDYLRFTLDAG
jgi:Acyl-coenzyme A:6-aminopenicillanic acid acyl-transferase